MNKENILKAIEELRKGKKRKFEQTADLIINLKNFDIKKDSVNLFLDLPYKIKDAKICAFFDKKIEGIDCITREEFARYKDKKTIKKMIKSYDFFISSADLMPQVAAIFGRYLGPAGKMPSPQLGIIKQEKEIKTIIKKFENIVRVKSKEPSLKFSIGRENMKNEEMEENVMTAYNSIEKALSRGKENVRSVMLKFSMTKPIKLEI